MDKIKTAVILSILTIFMMGVVIYLNRDKFSKAVPAPATPAAE